jgi:hypothetical protein
MSNSEITQYISAEAKKRGIDPSIALKVYKSEGAGGYSSGIRGEKSFGPYQLYMGGGLGNEFMKKTGINPATDRSRESITKQIQWSLDYAARTKSWAPWHGWKNRYGNEQGWSQQAGLIGAKAVGLSDDSAPTPVAQRKEDAIGSGGKLLPAPSREAADYHLVQPKSMKEKAPEELNAAFGGADMLGIGMNSYVDNDKWAKYAPESKSEVDKAFGPPPAAKQAETKEAQSKKNYHDTRISKPRHDPEAAGPTPGSDGYGSGACDPDGGGICSV